MQTQDFCEKIKIVTVYEHNIAKKRFTDLQQLPTRRIVYNRACFMIVHHDIYDRILMQCDRVARHVHMYHVVYG